MDNKTYIKGTYSRSIYQSNQGYYIGIFRVKETNSNILENYVGRTITFTGYFHELNDVDTYIFYGNLINHKKYGLQFQVDSYDRCMPEEKDSIVEFLSSDLFPGIGEKKAKIIVDTLGEDVLKIILETPNNLVLVPGITKKNIDTLYEKLREYESSYEVIIYLDELGFSTRDSMIIYNTYKNKTRKIIDEDIYNIVDDINGLGFKKIDMIALKNGYDRDDIRRVKAAIKYIMFEISNVIGHSYYSYEDIAKNMFSVLGVSISEDLFDNSLIELQKDLEIVNKLDRYYLTDMYDAECFIVKRIRMLNNKKDNSYKDIDSIINDLEEHLGIVYNEEQKDAIRNSILKNFLIITGGPGTGKTTILKGICELYRLINKYSYMDLNNRVALLAPTGRAAKRMSEVTLLNASTIHRFLKWNKENNKFQVNEYNKSKVELVIIDESSMIDTYLLDSLFKGLSSNCKIIMIGDDHQLPSVGPGQVLHDLISSNKLNVVELKQLYRQGENSNIVSLAYDVIRKDIDEGLFNIDEDLTFIKCSDNEVMNNILEISNTYKDINYKNFQILAPMYKGLNGIDEINRKVQEIFNEKDSSKNEYRVGDVLFREGDKVIQLTNMPDDNVYNGDIGIIQKINSNNKEIFIDFDNNIVRYTPSNFNNFRQAFSISIHKAQGSEFDIVILPLVKGYSKMLYQKLVYTGITRAKKKLYIIGDMDALRIACNNTTSDIRKTTICSYLIDGII